MTPWQSYCPTMRRLGVSVLVVVLCAMTPVTADASVAGPDLKVKSAKVTKPNATTLKLSDVTKNRGNRKAPRSRTGFFASKDTARGGDVKLTTRQVPALSPDEVSRNTKSIALPAGLAPGTYYVIACADATKVVTETREGNNCTLASGTFKVNPPPGKHVTWHVPLSWGTVGADPTAGTCDPAGADGSCTVPSGASVTLTAVPGEGFEFVNWTTDPNHTGTPCPVDGSTEVTILLSNIASDIYCNANFDFEG
jgi:hypothetical protein